MTDFQLEAARDKLYVDVGKLTDLNQRFSYFWFAKQRHRTQLSYDLHSLKK